MEKLRLIKEGKGVVSSDVEDRGTFTLNSNVTLAAKFNEDDLDIFFTLFECITDFQDWSEKKCMLLLQCVLTEKAQFVFPALSCEDCQSYEKIKSAVLKAYECVPEAYRQRFRACRKEHKQSHLEFCWI